jgi:hypothetical protein
MIRVPTAQANTGLSPEWDRWFDEAFTELVTHDEDLVRQEFDALIHASWRSSLPPPSSPASSCAEIDPTAPEGRRDAGIDPDDPAPAGDDPRPPP